jgi:peptide/nickel transport system permease protein
VTKTRNTFEKGFEKASRRFFSFNPILADKLSLWSRGAGKNTDLLMATWKGRVGLAIILFFVLFGVVGSALVPYDQYKGSTDIQQPSSWEHWFGTDNSGRDVFAQTVHGTAASLIVGFVAMAVSMFIGTVVGLASGYWGGWRDEVIMRINDVFLSVPWLVLMIVIASVWGRRDLLAVIVVIGISSWSATARIVRSQVLTLKTRQFVERAKAIGSGEWHVIRKHVFPNVMPLVFANAILSVAMAILSEATLSFLKLGPKDIETWGKILQEASNWNAASVGPYAWIIMPGLFIVLTILGFTLMGYAMDEVLNPKLKER